MKVFLRSTLMAYFGLSLLIYTSCSEDPAETPAPKPPAVLGSKIFKEVVPAKNGTMSIKDSVVVSFNEKNGKLKTIEQRKYRAIVDLVAIDGVPTTSVWASDSLSVTLYPKDMLSANASYTVKVNAHWEEYGTIWGPLVWEDVAVAESENWSFTTLSPELVIKASNVKYSYPIANQYHFLVEEHPAGFVKLNRGQKSLFTMSGFTYAAIFKKFTGETIETEVTYDSDKNQINFSIPQTLASETIYRLTIVVRQTNSGNTTTLLDYHFRTSKYRNFTAKFNSITYTGSTFSILMVNARGHYLHQNILSAGEYLDAFEGEVKNVTVSLGNPRADVNVPYASNLIQFQSIMPGNDWYDNALYPWLYAPWTDPTFKPTVSRDTSVVGYKPVKAMSFYNLGSGMLTPTIIEANNAPIIGPGTQPAIRHSLSLIIWQDWMEIQNQVVQRYINANPSLPREDKIIWNSFPAIRPGVYAYRIKYTLPSGQVTTTLTKIMSY